MSSAVQTRTQTSQMWARIRICVCCLGLRMMKMSFELWVFVSESCQPRVFQCRQHGCRCWVCLSHAECYRVKTGMSRWHETLGTVTRLLDTNCLHMCACICVCCVLTCLYSPTCGVCMFVHVCRIFRLWDKHVCLRACVPFYLWLWSLNDCGSLCLFVCLCLHVCICAVC